MSDPFARYTPEDVRDLLAHYPLAWVVARGSGASAQLPLLGEYDDGGVLVRLVGHMARRNPLHAALLADPTASILVTGPQAYVASPHAERQNWGPTWNYAQLAINATVTFEPENTADAVDWLVTAMEGTRWHRDALGDRYHGMLEAIIAFRADVRRVEGRFKLGQDEPRAVFDAIVRNHPDAALVAWMRRFDRG